MATARNHEQSVLQAFDAVAARYDSVFEGSERTRRLRSRIHSLVGSLVDPSSRILDINCGTGTDAVALAGMGHLVVGLDISPLMIKEATTKSAGVAQIQFLEGTFRDLKFPPPDHFDLVLSNFGGLNCTPDIVDLGTEVAQVLKPGGYFVAVVMPPVSLWEMGAKTARGQMIQAVRRAVTGRSTARFDQSSFQVFYHTPAALTRSLRSHFQRLELFGLNIFSPPPHAGKFAATFPRFSRTLARLDELIESTPLFRSMGDHYVAVFLRKADR